MNLFVKIGCYAAAAVFAAFLLKMEGTPVQIIIAAIGAFAVIMTIITIIQQREDKKSFTDAQRLKDGRIFTSEKESLRYEKWLERRKPQFPGKNMRSDLIARFRRPRIAAELFGAFALVPVLLILFKERSEGKEEPGVIYIVIGGMILLVCLAAAEIFGVKARRFYLCFTDRPDFRLIEQDYMRSEIIGQPAEPRRTVPDTHDPEICRRRPEERGLKSLPRTASQRSVLRRSPDRRRCLLHQSLYRLRRSLFYPYEQVQYPVCL